MVLHAPSALRPRQVAYALAYAAAMVGGTAALIAVLAGTHDDGRLTAADGTRVTVSEVVMQSAAERALVSPKAAVLAGSNEQNERRGL
jgi:hypothetical protein